MRIEPRREILNIWRAALKWSVDRRGAWVWGGRSGPNAISDAEQLLCLLLPPTRLPDIGFSNPDTTAPDVVEALAKLGNKAQIPQRVVRLIIDYLDRYFDQSDKVPAFSGGSYFVSSDPSIPEPTPEQERLEVVDAYAMSVLLTTSAITFLRDYREYFERNYGNHPRRKPDLDEIKEAEVGARRRLTAAMVGLQRSFTVNVFGADTEPGRALCRTVSQQEDFPPTVVEEIRQALRDVIAGLRELRPAPDEVSDLIDNRDTLFECGWSWGVVRGAPSVKTTTGQVFTQQGFAQPAPFLYFTVVAIDGIRDLFSSQTRIKGVLDDEQQEIARTLNLQWELARRYWSVLARLGTQRWALEDIPWRTSDTDESDYYSVLVTSLVVEALGADRAPDKELERVGLILEEFADRARITRRPLKIDPALELHAPGARITLVGSEDVSEGAPKLGWLLFEFSTLVLNRTLGLVTQVSDNRLRSRMLLLADRVWEHIEQRRMIDGKAAGLWDQPSNPFPAVGREYDVPSWYFTNRVVQCLNTAAGLLLREVRPGLRLSETAAELLSETEHLFDQEQLRGSAQGGRAREDGGAQSPLAQSLRKHSTSLARARQLVSTRPGTAMALLSEILRELDKLDAARKPGGGE